MLDRLSLPIAFLSARKGLSERQLALTSNISRECLRRVKSGNYNVELQSLSQIAKSLHRELHIIFALPEIESEFSTVGTASKVTRDGFNSWKIHFMDLVDTFRRDVDARLILLPPPKGFDLRLTALLASIVMSLCHEVRIAPPRWAAKNHYLDSPWFVSELESLKATSLLESPVWFRANNIFVQENFLTRA